MWFANVASSWTVLITTPTGETVAAGSWPDGTEAHQWARGINQTRLARVRGVFPLLLARDVRTELERGVQR